MSFPSLTNISALEYCHGQNITHRDLKPENLLFDASYNLKVADFGFATLLSGKDGSGKLHTYLGTANYMAPEIISGAAYNGAEVDLFAAAVILFIMYSGSPPFGQAHPERDQYYKLLCTDRQQLFWDAHERNKPIEEGQVTFYNNEFKDLIITMLSLKANERLTLEQIKQHPWYNGPLVDGSALKIEFQQRRKQVDAENKRQRELKKQEKLMVQMQQANFGQTVFTGIRPFRSLEIVSIYHNFRYLMSSFRIWQQLLRSSLKVKSTLKSKERFRTFAQKLAIKPLAQSCPCLMQISFSKSFVQLLRKVLLVTL